MTVEVAAGLQNVCAKKYPFVQKRKSVKTKKEKNAKPERGPRL
jgi:hypothetical protein